METIECKHTDDVPKNYTGIAVFPNGAKFWYKEGKKHRLDGPACEWDNGDKSWYKEGLLHRIDGPAVEWNDGTKHWYIEGKRHRIDGPAIEWVNGTKEWWINGNLHREDGPAIELADGTKGWYKEGLLHRINGPAIERSNGCKEWWINGIKCSFILDIRNKVFLGKEKGRYNLEWLKFLTEKEIEEIPIVPGLEYEFQIDLETLESFSKWKH